MRTFAAPRIFVFRREGEDGKALLRAITRTVAAFANTKGGTILVGIDDRGAVEGVTATDLPDQDRRNLQIVSAVRDTVRPVPILRPHFQRFREALVLLVCVPPGAEPPYLHLQGNHFYMRNRQPGGGPRRLQNATPARPDRG